MKNEEKQKIIFLILIVGRKDKDDILSALTEHGVRLINVLYGKGTVQAGYLQNILGLVPEKNKALITCVMTSERSNSVLEMLVERFDFDSPNTGVAFTMPIDKVSF